MPLLKCGKPTRGAACKTRFIKLIPNVVPRLFFRTGALVAAAINTAVINAYIALQTTGSKHAHSYCSILDAYSRSYIIHNL